MKRRYDEGGEVDAMEEANQRTDMMLTNPNAKEFGEPSTSETIEVLKAMTKAMPKAKAAPKSEAKAAVKKIESAVKEGDMSLSDRARMTRERARAGSGPTDMRSVGERIRSALGAGKNRGGNSVDFAGTGMGMKSGGKVSASSRADGIAQRGKTRGKMC